MIGNGKVGVWLMVLRNCYGWNHYKVTKRMRGRVVGDDKVRLRSTGTVWIT